MLVLLLGTFALLLGVLGKTTVIRVPGIGRIRCNSLGNGVTEALNLPFAMPPIGKDRFRPPVPWVGPIEGEINGMTYGPICVQKAMPGLPPMSEDCLRLNIWSPRHASDLPVFVFIHGGAFLAGDAQQYNGSVLAAQGSVIVTINYRLGALGWLPLEEISRENPHAPGDGGAHGFLDQLEALRWVRQHIAGFGGHPGQVTIGGESAGALSCCTHLHLQAAQGLFSRAVIESGSCVGPWGAWSNHSEGATVDLFKLSVGAFSLSSLRNASWEQLVNSSFWDLFTPRPDGWWLQKKPSELPVLSSKVQILVGSNTMDSLFGPPWLSSLPSVLRDVVPSTRFTYEQRVESYFGKEALTLYPAPSQGSANDYWKAFIRINTDVCNSCPKHWIARKLTRSNNTVFAYSFGFWPNTSSGGFWNGLACHGCETDYIFGTKVGKATPGPSGEYLDSYFNADLADAISGYVTRFVATGRPRGAVAWPEYGNLDLQSIRILKFAADADGKPLITQSKPQELPQCEFFQRFWTASSANKDRMDEFCSLPIPRLRSAEPKPVVLV